MESSNLIADKDIVRFLSDAANRQSIPHAMLFWGNEGTGKLAVAMAFAQFLLCLDPQGDRSCGNCNECRKSAKLIHPDIHFIFPTVGAKVKSSDLYPQWRKLFLEYPYFNISQWLEAINAENRQGNINASDCNNIIQQLSLKSFEGKYKILILWMAEYLGTQGNRLLKIIEEPPENTVIILIAENRDLILPTILSRCQQIYFKPFDDDRIVKYLVTELSLTPDKAAIIAKQSGGNWNMALHLAGGQYSNPVSGLSVWIKTVHKNRPSEIVSWVEQMAREKKDDQKHFLMYILQFLRKVVMKKYTGTSSTEILEEQMLNYLAPRLSLEDLEVLIEKMNDYITAIQRNAHVKILWMDASMTMKRALKHRKILEKGVKQI
jgi:DNA polymerase-3 subunit delta'